MIFINKLPKRFIEKITKDVAGLVSSEIEIEEIILFGSCARGNIKSTSDVDILVITMNSLEFEERSLLRSIVDYDIDGLETDIVFYGKDLLLKSNDTFTNQLKEEGITLWKRGDYTDEWSKLLCYR